MRKNKLKEIFKQGGSAINGWLQIPNSFTAELMANQNWDSLTLDMQHGVVDYSHAISMLQAISTTNVVPMARVNWNEPGQIMKILDAGAYGIICPMVSNRKEAENFVQACMYPPRGYRSYGPIRGLVYGGPDYADEANNEILKFAMIETKESLDNLDEIMQTPGLDGIYIGPADLSLALGEKPSFDKPEGDPVYNVIMKILEHAKKNKIIAGIQNAQPEYAQKMIKKGFQLVTIGTDQRFMTAAVKAALSTIRKDQKTDTGKGY
ncbi:aldolase/citrate lyase family protein [Pelagibacteraceae bacterium]|nr:aldolase/citrate lyase family protein [Pelagibacteraceae bacterium]